ncbi:MAG: carbamoyltransferase HypF [Tepidisphaeraceae bacterium]
MREAWRVVGRVQGVGFRPFAYREARAAGVTGRVLNDSAGVLIEAQGEPTQLHTFKKHLLDHAPALVRIERIDTTSVDVVEVEDEFVIAPSDRSQPNVTCDITIDSATCPDCLRELFDPTDPRFGHGLINCTNCGPRYSIVTGVPYDRPATTMASFAMCPRCKREYDDPADRRFHAQPTNCPDCGPQVSLVDRTGKPIATDPIAAARTMLADGKILAIKGLGGFHLACRADDEAAVQRLRIAKHRAAKPFAIMVKSIEQARTLVELSDAGAALLQSPIAPILLCARRHRRREAYGGSIAPNMNRLGVMLPNTPIQHLLFAGDVPWPALVMTSANDSAEPMVTRNADALARLGPLCDAILWHDRDIARPVDDSVVIDTGDAPILVRRARGYVPDPIELPFASAEPGLCIGGDLKCTIALVSGRRVVLSQHLGDLSHPATLRLLESTATDLQTLLRIRPRWIACDLHPGYFGTKVAQRWARELSIPLVQVQHHHAHAAAAMVEHGVTEPTLVLVCDGTGYGTDGTTWGGELLLARYEGFERLACLTPLSIPGGDAAAHDSRRPALALLARALGPDYTNHLASRELIPDDTDRTLLAGMIDRNVNCVPSSSTGRLFDAIAALLGVATKNRFEAECAMRLEALAGDASCSLSLRERAGVREDRDHACTALDFAPLALDLWQRRRAGEDVSSLALHFHEAFARAWADVLLDQAHRRSLRAIALTGGTFCNALLTCRLTTLLEARGLRVLKHQRVPPNDGGLALGQAAIAVTQLFYSNSKATV